MMGFAPSLLSRPLRPLAPSMFALGGRRSASTASRFLPNVKLESSTTLGTAWDACWTNYRYRLAYFPILWTAFMIHTFWVPYAPDSAKKPIRDRQARLEKLEFHQE